MLVRRAGALVLVIATMAAALVTSAGAAPNTDDVATATRAIEENGRRAGALSEALNGAEYRLQTATAELERSRAEVAQLRVQLAEDRARLAREGAGIYRSAADRGLLPSAVAGHDAKARRRIHYGAAAADATRRLVDDLVATQEALTEQESRANAARRDAQAERDRLARAREALAAADARQQQLLANAPAEVARTLSDTGAGSATASDAPTTSPPPRPTGAAPAPPTTPAPAPSAPPTSAPLPAPPAPAPSSGAAAAVAFAHAQLGKPYVYAAAGPDSYDCSGLTMAAWRAGGVSLPHYSGAQYSKLKKVAMNALQPGDLIFWGPGGSDHVAIYIGGGKIISAPYTGAVVRIQNIWGSPIGAARP